MTKNMDEYITVKEAAAELNVSVFLIQSRIRDGLIIR
jgi:hypothetical protein